MINENLNNTSACVYTFILYTVVDTNIGNQCKEF